MNSHHDDPTDRLVNALKPVRAMNSALLWAGSGVGLLLAAVFISLFYGFRPEVVALSMGTFPVNFTPIGKPLLFLILGVTALWSVSKLNRPQNEISIIHVFPIIIVILIVILNTILQASAEYYLSLVQKLHGKVLLCYTTIICGGAIAQSMMWHFWLSKGATNFPIILAAMSGLATSSLMASAYALHCPMDAPIYILLVYGTAVAIYTALSTLIGRHFLRW